MKEKPTNRLRAPRVANSLRTPKATNRLRVLRAEQGVTQLDVALKAGLKPSRYWQIEAGYREPTPSERKTLAKAFKVATEALGFSPDGEAVAS